MTEDIATVIAVLAALVATLSAIYARRQAQAAIRANEIALHQDRLSIYEGIGRFSVHIATHGTEIIEEEVWRFGNVASLAEFYFPMEIHKRLEEVFKNALSVLSLSEERKMRLREDPKHAGALAEPCNALMKATREECEEIVNAVKPHLRVGGG